MSDTSGPVQTDSSADDSSVDLAEPLVPPVVYPPEYPFAPKYSEGHPPKSALSIDDLEADLVRDKGSLLQPFHWGWFAAVVVACGFLNLILAPIVEAFHVPPLLVAAAYAVLVSELAAQSIWIVWSERRLWQRLTVGTLAGQFLLLCFLAGIGVSGPGSSNFEEIVRVAVCSLPLVMLCVQAPLWALRIYARWRIVPVPWADVPPQRPLAIGDIIAATAVVAVALALLRLASSDPEFYEVAWIGWAIAAPSIAAISLLSVPLAMYLVLARRRPLVGLFVWWGLATALVASALVVVAAVSRQPLRGEERLLLFITVYGAGGLLWLPLWAASICNYRLSTGNSARGTP
jgi:hypothetical protein